MLDCALDQKLKLVLLIFGQVVLCHLVYLRAQSLDPELPRETWIGSLEYAGSNDVLSLESSESQLVTILGGASFLSESKTILKLEANREAQTLKLLLPRGQFWNGEIEFGIVNYQVWIPSGSQADLVPRTNGWTLSLAAGIVIVPRTRVTPKVDSLISLRWDETSPDEIYRSNSSQWISEGFLWKVSRLGWIVRSEVPSFDEQFRPVVGFEIFEKRSIFERRSDDERLSGSYRGYRIFAAGNYQIAARQEIKGEILLGNETGYRIGLAHQF